jgi:hypothetical protein
LEKLFARHLLVPARAAFSAIKESKKTKILLGARNPLHPHLGPLRDEIVKSMPDVPKTRAIIRVLPLLLEEAIKLSPRATPRQKAAEIPWIESVFSALSSCTGQPIPYALVEFPVTDSGTKISPMANMLQVVQEQGISLSSDFLESILVDYSGLIDLPERFAIRNIPVQDVPAAEQERKPEPQWDLISVLLNLDGSIFLKKRVTESSGGSASYVDALVTSIATHKLKEDVRFGEYVVLDDNHSHEQPYPFDVEWDDSKETLVERILIPLMGAYAATRDMGEFLALWFRELRRNWNKIGTSEENCFAWTSDRLCQAFGDLLENSLTAAKIEDQIVEFSLPIKVLADEVARSSDHNVDWSLFSAAPPASTALVLMDALLQGIGHGVSVPTKIILLLNDLISPYAFMDMSKFKCASRIWSILPRIHLLVFRVDPEKALTLCPNPEILQIATNIIDRQARSREYESKYRAACEAYRFVLTVSSSMVNLPELRSKVEVLTTSANVSLRRHLDAAKAIEVFNQRDKSLEPSKIWFFDTFLVLIQYPSLLQ